VYLTGWADEGEDKMEVEEGAACDVLGSAVLAVEHVGDTLHAPAFTQLVGESLDA
jgi:hypothetical protein